MRSFPFIEKIQIITLLLFGIPGSAVGVLWDILLKGIQSISLPIAVTVTRLHRCLAVIKVIHHTVLPLWVHRQIILSSGTAANWLLDVSQVFHVLLRNLVKRTYWFVVVLRVWNLLSGLNFRFKSVLMVPIRNNGFLMGFFFNLVLF